MTINETTFPGRTYLVWRREIAISEITNRDMWDTAFGAVSGYIQEHRVSVVGPGAALYFRWDEAQGRTEIGIGLPVEGITELDDPALSLAVVPESGAAHALLRGDYSGLKEVHEALGAYVQEHQLNNTVVVEEYTVDPSRKTDPAEWETNVYYVYQ